MSKETTGPGLGTRQNGGQLPTVPSTGAGSGVLNT